MHVYSRKGEGKKGQPIPYNGWVVQSQGRAMLPRVGSGRTPSSLQRAKQVRSVCLDKVNCILIDLDMSVLFLCKTS